MIQKRQWSLAKKFEIALLAAKLKKINMSSNNKISHTVLLNEDTLVPEMGVNNWSWIGLVSGLRSDVLEAMDNLEIVSDAGVMLPCY